MADNLPSSSDDAPGVGTGWLDCPPLEAFRRYWFGCAHFSGVASRSEFWWPFLLTALIAFALGPLPPLALVWSLATFLPTLSSGVRRLRDAYARMAVPVAVLCVYMAARTAGLVMAAIGMGPSVGFGVVLLLKLAAFVALAILLARPSILEPFVGA